MIRGLKILSIGALLWGMVGCKKDEKVPVSDADKVNTVQAFYLPAVETEYGKNDPILRVVAGKSNGIDKPWDLDFHPTRENELWIINKGLESTGGSTVTIKGLGTSNPEYLWFMDGNAWHFMALPSALSFSQESGNWATTAEIQDANRQGGSFTGPTLWSSDFDIYAKDHGPGTNGSHLDMLHASPYSMGIESDKDNAFWVFDGYNRNLCWYDFKADHGPGNHWHEDGTVHRYVKMDLKREPGVASHMVLDRTTNWLYIADPANSRILRMNTKTGSKKEDLPLINEQLAEHWLMQDEEWEVFTTRGLLKPAGIEISNGVLYVSDHENGNIVAFSLETKEELARIETNRTGVMGIKADKNGHLYFVDSETSELVKVEPQ